MVAMLNIPLSKYVKITIQGANWEVTSVELLYWRMLFYVTQVKAVNTTLPWNVLGALPETMQTAWGSLFGPLKLRSGDRLLVRGGTITIGLAAIGLAKQHGAFVIATSRKPEREVMLREQGADDVIIDTGSIAEEVKARYPEGVDKVLELVGVTTM
jgi:NADPH:quinone reductase-like Zn-dependent oxidoreductase